MYAIILPLLILDISHSLADVGFYYSMIKIPSIVLLPFLGLFVERVSRKKLIFLCDLALLLIFCLQYLLFSVTEISIVSLIVIGIIINLIASINDIATRVIFSETIPKNKLVHYNGTKSIIDNSTIFIAPMVGSFLYGIFGIRVVFLLMICLYGMAALGIYFLEYTFSKVNDKRTVHILTDLSEGISFVKSEKRICAFFILATALNFFVASTEEIINPGILISKYAIPKKYFGFSSTFNILGIILAGMFIVRNKKFNYQEQLAKLFVVNSGVMILIGLTSVLFQGKSRFIFYGFFLFLQILLGFFTILINVPLTSYFQAQVPVTMQGRFFSFFSFAANLSIPFGIAYAGVMADKIGADITYIINNIIVILIVFLTYRSVDILGKEDN